MSLKNDLLLRTLKGEQVERPPIWLMRQAGRILPQYRAVRASLSGFIELVQTPGKVAEVTIQPVDELNVDAAIIFSDILVIPEAMGLPYELIEKKGPLFPNTLKSRKDIESLSAGIPAAERLDYVYEGIRQTIVGLENRVPLIGFAGSPFTLLCYMIEGQGSKTFSKAKSFLYRNPDDAHLLMDKLTQTIIEYLKLKIKAGVHAVQLFDSWAGVLDHTMYRSFCIQYIERIVEEIEPLVPVIVFSKGAWFSLEDLGNVGSSAIGIDWNIPVPYARSILGSEKVLQGNLDPCVLYADHQKIIDSTHKMLAEFDRNHIVNLGHGVYPDTPLEGVKCFVNTVRAFHYS
jgi:uroporphyrinogen decarboxylase